MWDGLGGMMKQWIRRRKVSHMSVNPNDPSMRCPIAEPETEGLMASAEECYRAWKGHFESPAWREGAAGSTRAVSAIFFHWAGEGAIVRPATDVQFDRLTGISSSYQYFMLREGEVLMRPYSCWCPACCDAAAAGPGARMRFNASYELPGCAKAGNPLYAWRNASCRAKNGAEASSPDKRAREHGHALAAAGISPGQWVLVEAFGDDEDEMWLGKTEAFFGSSCCKQHRGGQQNEYGTRFNTGDYMVAVQWYEERLTESDSGRRREFVRGERATDVINSTELRGVGVRVEKMRPFPAVKRGEDPEALAKWELSREDEAEALAWCR